MRKRDRETHNLSRPAEDSRGYILVARRGILRSTSAHVAATTRRLRRQRTMLLTSERRIWAEREKERARDRERENQTSLAESLSRVSWSSHLRSGESARFRCARKIKRERETWTENPSLRAAIPFSSPVATTLRSRCTTPPPRAVRDPDDES